MKNNKWEKIFFYNIDDFRTEKVISHAQLPTYLLIDNKVRVFFASRDKNQYSSVYYIDLIVNGSSVDLKKRISNPVLKPGDIGCFDQHGVYPSSVVNYGSNYYMYYIGWEKGYKDPLFTASIGLAKSENGQDFQKVNLAPIMGRSNYDPCLVTSPHVYRDHNLWHMNYVSGVKWEKDLATNELQSFYHIKSAVSEDMFNWVRNGDIAIGFKNNESNIARPSVYKENNHLYHMWYSYVDLEVGKYRIGYASSNNGKKWIRKDQNVGIGLDSKYCTEMIAYPQIFEKDQNLYMLYNGDNFGKQGFGIAICKNYLS